MSKEIIDAIASGDNLDAETHFKNALSQRVGDALEKKREEVNYYEVYLKKKRNIFYIENVNKIRPALIEKQNSKKFFINIWVN